MKPATFGLHLRALGALDFPRIRRAVQRPLPPTLIAYARDDHMLESWISEELVRALPGARVLVFEQGGHNLQKTRAVELARAIKEAMAGEAARNGGSQGAA
jgi:pimeloyl-ACP methyl ester carboxylesterase